MSALTEGKSVNVVCGLSDGDEGLDVFMTGSFGTKADGHLRGVGKPLFWRE